MFRLMIVDFLKRLLALFDDKPSKVEAWPFPVEIEKLKVQGKKKPVLKKATTRKPKVVAKTARNKAK